MHEGFLKYLIEVDQYLTAYALHKPYLWMQLRKGGKREERENRGVATKNLLAYFLSSLPVLFLPFLLQISCPKTP